MRPDPKSILLLVALLLAALPATSKEAPLDDSSSVGRLLTQLFQARQNSIVRVTAYRAQGPFPQSADGLGRLSRLEPNRRTLWASGVVVGASGLILTCAEAAQPGDSLVVCTADGQRSPARFLAQDALLGVTLIQTKRPIRLDVVARQVVPPSRPGDWLLVLSYCGPDAQPSLRVGTWDAAGQIENARSPYLRLDLVDCEGICGGAVIDGSGGFRGLVVASRVERDGSFRPTRSKDGTRVMECDGAWALKAACLDSLRSRLLAQSEKATGYLGVQIEADDDSARAPRSGPSRTGPLRVVSVVPGSPAETAGILPDDQILAINGRPITKVAQITQIVSSHRPGTEIQLGLLRRGVPLTLTTALVDRSALDWIERERQLDQLLHSRLERSLRLLQDRLRRLEAVEARGR